MWVTVHHHPSDTGTVQVLMSIQGMILGVAHPLYNEPGLGGFGREGEGAAGGGGGLGNVSQAAVRCYDERTQLATLRVGIIAHIRSPPSGFEEVVRLHLSMKRGEIMQTARRWLQEGKEYRELNGVTGVSEEFEERMEKTIEDVRRALEGLEPLRTASQLLEGLEPSTPMPVRVQNVELESESGEGAAGSQHSRGSRNSNGSLSGEGNAHSLAGSGVGLVAVRGDVASDLVEGGRDKGGAMPAGDAIEAGSRANASASDDDDHEQEQGGYDQVSHGKRDALENDRQSLLRSPGAARRV